MAVPLMDKGVVVVAVGYDIAPKGRVDFRVWILFGQTLGYILCLCPFALSSGTMDLMVSQVRRSVVSVVQQYSHIRYPPHCSHVLTEKATHSQLRLQYDTHVSALPLSGLYLCGHSAGAHLAAMVLSTDWSQYSITPQIKGTCATY